MTLERRIASLGGLHDAMVTAIEWQPADRRLRIVVDDVHANQRDLPGDPGREGATVTFSGVTRLAVSADLAVEGLTIFEWTVGRPAPDVYASQIAFAPGGRMEIDCREIDIATNAAGSADESDRVAEP